MTKRDKLLPLMREAAASGTSMRAFAAEHGVHYLSVSRWAREEGVRFRNPLRKSGARSRQMAALYRAGYTLKQIGDQFGVTRERVRQLLSRDFGFDARSGGQHKAAIERAEKARIERNARALQKHGCPYDQYRTLVRMGVTQRYIYQRNAARQRGIGWEFNLWQWWCIWRDSGHWHQRGRGQGYVMCRKGDLGPYSPGNVFIALAAENSSEQARKKSGLPRGVRHVRRRYVAVRSINGQQYRIGSFPTPEQAHAAYLSFDPSERAAA